MKNNFIKLILISLAFISLSIFSQDNIIYFSTYDYNKTLDSIVLQPDSCNLTTLVDAGQLTIAGVTAMVNNFTNPRMLNPEDNKIYVNQYLSAMPNWGTTALNNFAVGNYNSYLTYDQRMLHKLYFSSPLDYYNERGQLLIRCRHLLYARTSTLLDSLSNNNIICICWGAQTGFIAGKIEKYSIAEDYCFIEVKGGNGTYKKVSLNTVAPATNEEIIKYY